MVGSSVVRRLVSENCEIVTVDKSVVDLTNQTAVNEWVGDNKPDFIVLAAAKVGGILANDSRPAEFIYSNLCIQNNVIDAAYRCGTRKLLFLGSSCIYPKEAAQPITEDALLTGPLELTNQWYAVAKIAGIKMCQAYRRQYGCDFISAMPTNLYGPGDNFELQSSHVLPALMRKIHDAKITGKGEVVVWGDGTPRREFMHVDDLADALVFLLKTYSEEDHINVGTGEDLEIRELAHMIGDVIGWEGELKFDLSKPNGTLRKLMSGDKLQSLGWNAQISLRDGLKKTYAWYLDHLSKSKDEIRM